MKNPILNNLRNDLSAFPSTWITPTRVGLNISSTNQKIIKKAEEDPNCIAMIHDYMKSKYRLSLVEFGHNRELIMLVFLYDMR
jgi:hypothetical protein